MSVSLTPIVIDVAALVPDDGAAAAIPTFGATYIGHWSADNVVLDGSGNVQTWSDLSGNGNDLTQATAGARGVPHHDPTMKNRNSVELNGSNQYWSNTLIKVGGSSPPAYSQYTLIVLARLYNSVTPGQALVAAADNSGADNTGPELFTEATDQKVVFSTTGAFLAKIDYPWTEVAPPVTDPFTRWHYYVGRHSASSRSLSLDGGTPGVGSGTESPNAIKSVYLGRLPGEAAWFMSGSLARAWLLGGDVTSNELSALATYMSSYYGVVP